ncbi:WhiB family transcriptional regulator [Streptomyces parvulus]
MTAVRDWELLSACRDHDPEIWFSDRTRSRAKEICGGCLVQEECLAAVLAREDGVGKSLRAGIAAGLTGAQRYEVAQEQAALRPAPAATKAKQPTRAKARWKIAPCGTRPAYQRHLRNKEPIDEPCRIANNAYDRELRNTGTTRVRTE